MSRISNSTNTQKFVKVLRQDPCAYCGKDGGTADHIIPMSDFKRFYRDESPIREAFGDPHVITRGISSWSNLTGSCADCNLKKASKKLIMFMLETCYE